MSPFLQLLLGLIVIVTSAKLGGLLVGRLRQPAVLGELLVGLILGPTVLDMLHWTVLVNAVEPLLLEETLFELAEMGVVCLMFLAGLEVNLREMRQAGKVSLFAGISGVLVPLALGWLVALPFGLRGQSALFAGMILTATSVSISAQTLLELGVLRSREGIALLGAAVADDVLVIFLLSVFVAMAGSGATIGDAALVLLKMIGYLALAALIGFLILPRLAAWVERQPISQGLAALVLVTMWAFAWSAEVVGGLAAITGAFIAGMGFGRCRMRAEIERSIHVVTYAFLVPVFFVSIGLKTDLTRLGGRDIGLALALLAVAVFSKIVGCGLGARLAGFSNKASLRVGVGMVSRGEVGLIVGSVAVNAGLLPATLFSTVTFIVLFTTLITPPLLRLTFRGEEVRNAKDGDRCDA